MEDKDTNQLQAVLFGLNINVLKVDSECQRCYDEMFQ